MLQTSPPKLTGGCWGLLLSSEEGLGHSHCSTSNFQTPGFCLTVNSSSHQPPMSLGGAH